MAETPNARRERIAEALYVMMVGHATHNRHWSAALCAQKAREWADTFVNGAPEQPQPPADGLPTLLAAAARVVLVWEARASPASMEAACGVLRDAIAREEAHRG